MKINWKIRLKNKTWLAAALALLAALTFGIGNLWLTPYKQAARAAFYRDLLHPQPDPLLFDL